MTSISVDIDGDETIALLLKCVPLNDPEVINLESWVLSPFILGVGSCSTYSYVVQDLFKGECYCLTPIVNEVTVTINSSLTIVYCYSQLSVLSAYSSGNFHER